MRPTLSRSCREAARDQTTGSLGNQQAFGFNSKCRGKPLEKFKYRVRGSDLLVFKNHSSSRKVWLP